MENGMELLTNAAAIGAAIVAAVVAARKIVGGPVAAKLLQRQLEESSVYQYPVVLVALSAAEAIGLRTTLVERGFRNIRVVGKDDFERQGEELVVLVLADGFDHGTFAGEHALVEGLLYIEGRATPPPGDWTFANSSITLHARLRELVEWVRSAQK